MYFNLKSNRRFVKVRVIESRTVYRGRTINLKVERVEVNGREVVEHRGASVIVPVREDGKLVLVRQYRRAVDEVLLEFPAGTLEPGEDPESCARRELLEETGHEALNIERLASIYPAPGYASEVMHIFLARARPAGKDSPEVDEEIEVVMMNIDELLERIRAGEVKDAKTVVGALLAAERLLGHGRA
jgi:ADP-ribose pyrophosphatase